MTDEIDCKSHGKMRDDVLATANRIAAQIGGRFVCRECGRPFDRNHLENSRGTD